LIRLQLLGRRHFGSNPSGGQGDYTSVAFPAILPAID
jgi:hypothetical protein